MLINRIVNLTIRVATMDRKFVETAEMTEHDTRTYLAWSASLSRLLRDLGMEGAPTPAPTIADIFAKGRAA
jgi:hypothetical protein